MPDLNSKIEAKKAQVANLKQELEKAQNSKKDQTMAQAVRGQPTQPAAIRSPPATKLRRTLKGHFGKITALHWGGDSRTLVSASQDGNLLLWNAVTSNKLESIGLKSSYVMSVCIEQTKGDLVACGGLDNLCTIYKRTAPDRAVEMASHDGFLSCCRFLNEQEIVTSSGDSTCIHWNIPSGKPISTFAEHTADAMWLSLKPGDKNVFASCSVDQSVKVWDIRAPKSAVQTFSGHTGDINSVEFMPSDGNCFATCSQDNTVRLFDLRAYNELWKYTGTASQNAASAANTPLDGFTSLAISNSGRLIFCGHSDGNVFAFDIFSERNASAFSLSPPHDRHVSCVGVSPQGNALCSGSWDAQLKIWA